MKEPWHRREDRKKSDYHLFSLWSKKVHEETAWDPVKSLWTRRDHSDLDGSTIWATVPRQFNRSIMYRVARLLKASRQEQLFKLQDSSWLAWVIRKAYRMLTTPLLIPIGATSLWMQTQGFDRSCKLMAETHRNTCCYWLTTTTTFVLEAPSPITEFPGWLWQGKTHICILHHLLFQVFGKKDGSRTASLIHWDKTPKRNKKLVDSHANIRIVYSHASIRINLLCIKKVGHSQLSDSWKKNFIYLFI